MTELIIPAEAPDLNELKERRIDIQTRRAITRSSLNGVLLRYPVMTGKVIMMIYWQALRLVLKKTPFFAHPKESKPGSKG